tara:strand:- start:6351 stop:6578 length:228 start_codon:yes stop_codon:yes gene_type:complete
MNLKNKVDSAMKTCPDPKVKECLIKVTADEYGVLQRPILGEIYCAERQQNCPLSYVGCHQTKMCGQDKYLEEIRE